MSERGGHARAAEGPANVAGTGERHFSHGRETNEG